MNAALVAVPLVPLAAAALCWALPRSSRLAGPVAAAAPLLALAPLFAVPEGGRLSATWVAVGAFELTLGLRCDGLARTLAVFVAPVCSAVALYSVAYMASEERRARFFAWMSAFAGAMLALVLADSLLLLFGAWEMVSVASYALIAFHHRERAARRAADRAFVVTRAGDLGLLLALATTLAATGSTDLGALEAAIGGGQVAGATLGAIALGLLVAAIAKSAQLPLSAWLPGAMVAPTPVSALLHSATMVAAGVFLVARTWPVFAASPSAQALLAGIGGATAVVAALVATASRDLKRLLAWSTISQLGEMMLVLGLASPAAAVFHLLAHGVFKAALFALAGSIDQRSGSRRLDQLGGLAGRAPWLAAGFAIAGLALAGVPPLAGYYSGEALLGAAAAASPLWAALLCANLFLAGVYIARAFAAVFLPWPGAPRPPLRPARPAALLGIAPLVAAAAALGLAAKHPLERALALPAAPSPAALWSAVAIAASVAGVGLGLLRVWRRGPVPALGWSWRALERASDAFVALPARALAAVAAATRPVEAALDALAQALARAVRTGARALDASEAGLDLAARAAARSALRAGVLARRADDQGLGAGLDRAAAQLGRAGQALRQTQTGAIYHYAMSLFVWALLGGLIAVVLWS